ncbi:MAG: thiolase family protein, partial [Aquiluna sp.]|nr:thiolase family protein [Aquiluna sp.]
MMEQQNVYFVDGVRTPFGKAGEKGVYWNTRADDLVVKAMIGLLDRHPDLDRAAIDDVAVAATTQTGDQGLTIGRTSAILAGLPQSVPGYAIDRMCAGAMTAVTTTASAIGIGAYDIALAGGVEHMGRHPMGFDADPNPRFLSEKLVNPEALNMGNTAEKIHDRYPQLTKERADAFAVGSQQKAAKAYQDNKIQPDLVPVSAGSESGWSLVTKDELMRPESTLEGMKDLKTPFRPHGKVTAGNASPLTDGATVSLLAGERALKKHGLKPKMKLVSFAFAGVEPEIMGIGPIPATEKALEKAGLTIDDIGLFEINEAFAVQVLSFL